MKKKILLLIIFLISIFFSTNIYAYDKYDGDYTIEYLLKNYNVVTLGTKDRYNYSVMNNTEDTPGSVTNIFDIGGPILIRGNYKGSTSLDYGNEYAQKTNGIPSYIKGKIGSKIKAGSIESAEVSDIYVGSSNTVTKVGDNYKVNKDTYLYPYEVKVSDDYIDFDRLYAAVVNEQKRIPEGTRLTLNYYYYNEQSEKNNFINSLDYRMISGNIMNMLIGKDVNPITTSGNYTISKMDDVNYIQINNYDPNALYVITAEDEYIYSMPIIYLSKSEGIYIKLENEVYKGRTNTNEIYNGNIIFNFPNARYIHTNYSHIGHIIAPKADVELTETSYPGSIIANSITSKSSNYTAIQFYPYTLDRKLSNQEISTVVDEKEEIDTDDLYNGDYSIDELIKHYSVVSLGQKNYSANSNLKNITNKKGTVEMFHIVGQFLVYGNLGADSRTLRLDNKYNNENSHSYVRGDFNKYTSSYRYTLNYEYSIRDYKLSYSSVNMHACDYFFNGLGPNLFIGNSNKIYDSGDRDLYWAGHAPIFDSYGKVVVFTSMKYSEHLKKASTYMNYNPIVYNNGAKYSNTNDIFNSDNYINFEILYNSIVDQQRKISKGTTINGNNYTDFNADIVDVNIGQNYTIDNISNIKRLRFNNFEENENKLTIITINDSGEVTLPWLIAENSNGNSVSIHTNDWYGVNKQYFNYSIYDEIYHGNIVWNIPNATKVTNYDANEFIGHIIAPNADVELKATTAGAIIANSVYGPGNQEAHFYPLTVGSVGTGIEKEIVTLGAAPEKIKISGKKIWNDNNNQDGVRPSKVTIRLLANGVEVDSKEVKASDNWKYTFEANRVDEYGVKINYTITEDAIENYSTVINEIDIDNCPTCNLDSDVLFSYDIENSYTPKKTSLTVSKVWNDENNQDELRPNKVLVQLYANGTAVGEKIEIKEENNWTYTFNNLDMNSNGEKINYTVVEDEVSGYTNEVTGNQDTGYIITNTHEVDKIVIKGTKIWDDKNDQDRIRPERVTINLLADGVKIASKEVTAEDDWKFEFKELYDTKANKKIKYTITEDAIENYSTSIVEIVTKIDPKVFEYNIINSYTPEKTSVTVNKVWQDNNSKKRPKKVKVYLYGNTEKVAEGILTKENNWTYIFNDIDMNSNGEKITYTIVEEKVNNYTNVIEGNQEEGYTITNTYILSEENPTTGDNIMKYIVISVISIISIISLIIVILVYRKRKLV